MLRAKNCAHPTFAPVSSSAMCGTLHSLDGAWNAPYARLLGDFSKRHTHVARGAGELPTAAGTKSAQTPTRVYRARLW